MKWDGSFMSKKWEGSQSLMNPTGFYGQRNGREVAKRIYLMNLTGFYDQRNGRDAVKTNLLNKPDGVL